MIVPINVANLARFGIFEKRSCVQLSATRKNCPCAWAIEIWKVYFTCDISAKVYDLITGAFWMQNLCSFTTLPDSIYAQTHTDAPGQTLLNVRCTNALLVLRVVTTSRVLLYSYRHHAHRKISFSIRVFLFLNPLRVRDSGSEWHAHPGVNNFQLLLSLIIQSALRNAFNTPISDAWNDGYIGRYSNKI